MKIAVTQAPVSANVTDNGDAIRTCIKAAADNGARLVCLGEASLSGFTKKHIKRPEQWTTFDWQTLDGELEKIADLCRSHGIFAAVGTARRSDPGQPPFNSLQVISDAGELISCYDKRFLSNNELQDWYTPGRRAVTFSIDDYRFGCAICIETQFPEIFAEYERLDVDVVLFPAMSLPSFFQISTLAHAGHNCLWIAAATAAQNAHEGTAGIAGPDGAWKVRCEESELMAITDINRHDPVYEVAISKARPWRRLARQGDIYKPRR